MEVEQKEKVMRTWTRRLLIVGALVAIPTVGAVAWASDGERRGKYFRRHIDAHLEDVLDDLEATPEQRQTINKAKEQIIAKVETYRTQRKEVRDELLAMLKADRVDTNRLNQLADEKAAEVKNLVSEIIPIVAEVHASLTPAQRQELAERAESFRGRHGRGRW